VAARPLSKRNRYFEVRADYVLSFHSCSFNTGFVTPADLYAKVHISMNVIALVLGVNELTVMGLNRFQKITLLRTTAHEIVSWAEEHF